MLQPNLALCDASTSLMPPFEDCETGSLPPNLVHKLSKAAKRQQRSKRTLLKSITHTTPPGLMSCNALGASFWDHTDCPLEDRRGYIVELSRRIERIELLLFSLLKKPSRSLIFTLLEFWAMVAARGVMRKLQRLLRRHRFRTLVKSSA
jgi:hypothetical protein